MYTDERGADSDELLAAMLAGGEELEQAIVRMYEDPACRGRVVKFVRSKGGTQEDAEDVFQESVRLAILGVRGGKYAGTGSLAAYVFGVSRNLWYKRFQQKVRLRLTEDSSAQATVPEAPEDPEAGYLEEELRQHLNALLDQLSPKCREVLELWKLSYSMREIAERVGYKSEGVARKKKRLCLVKLIELLDANPERYRALKAYMDRF